MRPQQRLAERLAQVGDVAIDGEAQLIEHDLPGQRIAVGVQARGRQPEQHVARRRCCVPSINRVALNGADDEARDVVLAFGVEAWHLRGLAAQERTAVVLACRGPAPSTICSATSGDSLPVAR